MDEQDDLGDIQVDQILKYSNENTNLLHLTQTFRENPQALETMSEIDDENDINETLDDEDLDIDFPDESTGRKKRKRGGKRDNIPEEIKNLIGEANKEFALRNIHKSIDICQEIIRQAPRIRDPWTILGTIFEEAGKPERAFDFLLISALLSKNDTDKNESWNRLAEMASSLSKWDQAVYCYTKLIRTNKEDSEEHYKALFCRSLIYRDHLANSKKAIEGFEMIFKSFPSDYSVAKILVDMYWEIGKIDDVIAVLEKHLKNSSPPDMEQVNNLAICYLRKGEYNRMIAMILEQTRGVENVPLEIRIKLAICYVVLGNLERVDEVVDKMPTITPELIKEYFDDFMVLVDYYINSGETERALSILRETEQTMEILAKFGFCFYQMQTNDDTAIEYFEKYMEKAKESNVTPPNEVKSTLMELYKHKNTAKALSLVTNSDDMMLNVKKGYLLMDEDKYDEMLEICLPFVENFVEFQQRKKKHTDQVDPISDRITRDELSELIVNTCKVLVIVQNAKRALEIYKIASESRKVFEEEKLSLFLRSYIGTAWHLKEFDLAVNAIRDMLLEDPEGKIFYWNLLNTVIWKAENVQLSQKFLVRMLEKHPDNLPLQVMVGHASAIRETFRYALASYLKIYQQIKDSKDSGEVKLTQMICLCIGVTYLHISTSRNAANRQLLVMQAFTFLLEYSRLSGDSEESQYNLGRAYHQLGLYHYAIYYYEKLLRSNGDFVQEVAYNLANIYKKTGNTALARQIIQENIVI